MMKIPQQREIRKLPRGKPSNSYLPPTAYIGTYTYFSVDYLNRIGVPTNNLKDPVLVKLLPLDQFIIVKTNGKENTYSPGIEIPGQEDTRA